MLKNKKNSNVEESQADETPKNETNTSIDSENQGDNANEQQDNAAPSEDVQISPEEKLRADLAEANDKFLRLYAEFDNYKRRTIKERAELLQTAGKDVLQSLLPVLDDFERALKSMETANDVSSVKEGVLLVQSKLKNILTQKGVKEMESIGQPFDADIHEAITNIPAPDDSMKGKVIDQVEKGYYLNDKVIRFAKVVVGS